MGKPRSGGLGDAVRVLFHSTGVAWLTPLVGKQDRADLEYLRSAVLRDYEWVKVLTRGQPTSPLVSVQADLGALIGEESSSGSSYGPIVHPWHVPSGWTDYGAIRLAMLASLPVDARLGALAELGRMAALVLPGNRPAWTTEHAAVTALASDAATATNASIPHRMQALWREIDFGRNYWRARVAKNTTITAILWSMLVIAVVTTVAYVTRLDDVKAWVDLTHMPRPVTAPILPPDLWLIALLGLLGGTISALRSTDLLSMPERRSIEVEAVRLRLRPVVGAAMAVVVYLIGRSEIVFQLTTSAAATAPAADAASHHAPIVIQVPVVAWGYYALAFLAGFSERWFLRIIEIAESRVDVPPAAQKAPPAAPPPAAPPPAPSPPAEPPPAEPPPAEPPPAEPPPANVAGKANADDKGKGKDKDKDKG